MQVITIFNEKGGVGKTTLAGVIGAGLAMRGKRVLLVDADGQGDLTTNMGIQKQAGFYKFVKWGDPQNPDYVDVKNLVHRVPEDACPENLYLIPGSNDSWGIPAGMMLSQIVGNLARRIKNLEALFDYLVIDTQPSASTLHDAIGLVTDWFICPTDAEPLSAYGGLRSTIAHIEHIHDQSLSRGRDKARLLGIIPNKYRTNTALHQHIFGKLKEIYGDLVFDPLPLRTALPEAQFKQTTLMYDAPELETNQFLWSIIDRILKRTERAS